MQIITHLASCKGLLFTLVIFWQTSLVANPITEHLVENADKEIEIRPMPEVDVVVKNTQVKFIQIEVVKLTDNRGLTYIGGKVSSADLASYLSQMKQILSDDFALYRRNQSARDHYTFHMTLVNPYEYQSLDKELAIGTFLSVSLHGLARVSLDNKTTYFVVAQSLQAKNYRQNLVLTTKDFHVTLGFNPSDIYGVNKGVESLIE